MIKAVIIDDEQYCIDSLNAKLQYHAPDLIVVAAVSEATEMENTIVRFQPHVIFLDINLGPITGFDLIEKLTPPIPKIIFTTAYDQFAIKAFKYNAIDYLLKPIDEEELSLTIKKLKSFEAVWPNQYQLANTISYFKDKPQGFNKLALPTLTGYELIDLNELIRLEAASNYTHFFLQGNKKITISKTLKEYEDMLNEEGFVRIHQSHIINLRFITRLQKGKTASVIMQDGVSIDVGATRRHEFMEKFREFFRAG